MGVHEKDCGADHSRNRYKSMSIERKSAEDEVPKGDFLHDRREDQCRDNEDLELKFGLSKGSR